VKRREFITLLSSFAASWPVLARAQQPTKLPVIGFLSSSSPTNRASLTSAFRQGVREGRYVEGKDVAIEYRWAEDQYDRLPDLAADLVARQVAVIAATDSPSAIAAKAATTTIPIIFMSGGDPIQLGLVASLNRPNSNATGVTFLVATLATKLVGLLHDLLPQAARMALLVDPNMPITGSFVSDALAAVAAIGKQMDVLHASTGRDIDTVFSGLAQKPVDALLVGPAVSFKSVACNWLHWRRTIGCLRSIHCVRLPKPVV
jgi:putative tryptophan/tyrosine transport system substrate-binding protein